MTQEAINVLYSLTISIHENSWFGERKTTRNREEVQEWVAKKLANTLCVYTIPCGMSWGILVDKNQFEEYWKEHSKIIEL